MPHRRASRANLNDSAEERAAAKKLIGATDLSYDRIRELLDEKLAGYFPSEEGAGPTARLSEVYPSYAIAEYAGRQYKLEYRVQAGEVTTGKPEEVADRAPTSQLASARQELMAEVTKYAAENNCSVAVALTEITKTRPELWEAYSRRVMRIV